MVSVSLRVGSVVSDAGHRNVRHRISLVAGRYMVGERMVVAEPGGWRPRADRLAARGL